MPELSKYYISEDEYQRLSGMEKKLFKKTLFSRVKQVLGVGKTTYYCYAIEMVFDKERIEQNIGRKLRKKYWSDQHYILNGLLSLCLLSLSPVVWTVSWIGGVFLAFIGGGYLLNNMYNFYLKVLKNE